MPVYVKKDKELIYHGKDEHKKTGKPIQCSRCGGSGGTLVRIDDHYEHQDKAICRIVQMRKRTHPGS